MDVGKGLAYIVMVGRMSRVGEGKTGMGRGNDGKIASLAGEIVLPSEEGKEVVESSAGERDVVGPQRHCRREGKGHFLHCSVLLIEWNMNSF